MSLYLREITFIQFPCLIKTCRKCTLLAAVEYKYKTCNANEDKAIYFFMQLATIDLRTLKLIIMVASMINNKMKRQRSRAGSTTSLGSDASSRRSSRYSRRSEALFIGHQEELSLVDAILNILSLKLAK